MLTNTLALELEVVRRTGVRKTANTHASFKYYQETPYIFGRVHVWALETERGRKGKQKRRNGSKKQQKEVINSSSSNINVPTQRKKEEFLKVQGALEALTELKEEAPE